MDTALITQAIEEDSADDLHRFGLKIIYRYDQAPKPFGLIMNGPMARIDPEFNKAELQPNNKFNNGSILNVLNEAPATYGELLAKVKMQTGMGDSTFKRYWKAVKETAGVTEVDGKWRYEAPGLTAPIPTIATPRNN